MSDDGELPTTEPTAGPPPPPAGPPTGAPSSPPMPPPTGAPVYSYPYPAYPPTYPPVYPPGSPQAGYYLTPLSPSPYAYPRDHPQGGLALGLGLGGLIGGFVTLGVAFALGPFAWFIGQRARTEIRQSNGAYHQEGNATAGMVLGIIATVLLGLAIILWILVAVGPGSGSSGSDGGTPALAAHAMPRGRS